jgi:hypothetical protein
VGDSEESGEGAGEFLGFAARLVRVPSLAGLGSILLEFPGTPVPGFRVPPLRGCFSANPASF